MRLANFKFHTFKPYKIFSFCKKHWHCSNQDFYLSFTCKSNLISDIYHWIATNIILIQHQWPSPISWVWKVKSFTKFLLREHLLTHTARVFQCDQCEFRGYTKYDLGKHYYNLHEVNPPKYVCNLILDLGLFVFFDVL